MTRTISISTNQLRQPDHAPFPLHDLGIDRAEAARIIERIGLQAPRKTSCGWTPRMRLNEPDDAVIRSLLLGPLETRLRDLCGTLGLRGQTHRVVALAMAVAEQGLKWPIEPGTRVVSKDGRRRGVVVGVKPIRFVEDWQREGIARRERSGERFVRNEVGQDEPLVWTVDDSSETPGISQGRLADWDAIPK